MIANALFAATGLTLALVFYLANELRFLIPYRLVLVHQCGVITMLFGMETRGKTLEELSP